MKEGLSRRVLVRLTEAQYDALEEFARRDGHGADSTAIRMILVKALRAEGLMK